jgi:hypothetical protein
MEGEVRTSGRGDLHLKKGERVGAYASEAHEQSEPTPIVQISDHKVDRLIEPDRSDELIPS